MLVNLLLSLVLLVLLTLYVAITVAPMWMLKTRVRLAFALMHQIGHHVGGFAKIEIRATSPLMALKPSDIERFKTRGITTTALPRDDDEGDDQ